MTNTLDFDYNDYDEQEDTGPKYPAVGSYQVIQITGAEYKEFDSGAKQISIKGTFSEYAGTMFYSELWIPRDKGDSDAFARDRSKFLGQLSKMGVSLKRGMLLEDVALAMVGRFARSKVVEKTDYKDETKKWIKPSYLGELTDAQKKVFVNPASDSSAASYSEKAPVQAPVVSTRRGFGRG